MTAAQIRASLTRFTTTIQAVAPGALAHGNADGTVTIDFAAGTTAQQITNANAAAAAFDWSQAAQDAYASAQDDAQWPDFATLRAQATAAVTTNNAYHNGAQGQAAAIAQVDVLTQQNTQLIKTLGAAILRLTGR
jgi:hypothetical protein